MKKNKFYIVIIIGIILLSSCKKWVDVGTPSIQLSAENIFESDAAATSSILSIYSMMEADGFAYNIIINTGRSADELRNHSTAAAQVEIINNNLTSGNTVTRTHWVSLYKYIYQANALLEGLDQSSKVSEVVKRQLEGEAHFVRALCHFYLGNLYGDVPIITETSYEVTSLQPRDTISKVYTFIKDELNKAIELLKPNYLNASNNTSTERVRPNQSTAHALLSRVYLYLNEWDKAEAEATVVIDNTTTYSLLSNLDQVFLKNSKEAIWQLQSQVPGYNSYPGAFLILTSTPRTVSLDTNFVKSFSAADMRRSLWIRSITSAGKIYYYPFKYKVGQNASAITEYTMVFRLSEQFLIRSEARAMQDNLSGAEADLNAVHTRTGLSAMSGLSRDALLDSIARERKYELFAEFGDRWFNLKRTGTATPVLSAIKGANWVETDKLYPVPLTEINLNPNLTQNDGY